MTLLFTMKLTYRILNIQIILLISCFLHCGCDLLEVACLVLCTKIENVSKDVLLK